MAGVQPLTGLAGWVNQNPEATPEQRMGGPADPRHASVGEVASPYPWEEFAGLPHGPYGAENDLLGMDTFLTAGYVAPAGQLVEDPTADLQEVTRAAPWPKGVPGGVDPDSIADWRAQETAIHGMNMGASREMLYEPTLNAKQDQWTELSDTSPGISHMQPIPDQVKTGVGGWGSTDRVQSNARQNQYGFDSAHMHRRFAEPNIPGNYMWMEPGSRPMVKSIPGTAQIPTGQDSPFTGQDTRFPFGAQGAALNVLPTEYQAPPLPAKAASYTTDPNAATVEYW